MKFLDLVTADEEAQISVLEWRNSMEIRQYMYMDHIITIEEHKKWLQSLKGNIHSKVFIAFKGDLAIGVASISNIDDVNRRAEWAFYLNPDYLGAKGLGTLLEYHFLNYMFDNLEIEKLNCEVLETNPSVVSLHKKFGFTEEGIRRKNIIKNNTRIDVHLLGILKDEWSQIKNKFEKIIERLEK